MSAGCRQCIAASPVEQLPILRLGARVAFLVRPVCGSLDVDGQHVFLPAASHAPTPSQAPQGVAHRRSDASSEVVFEVTVWKADNERPGGDEAPLFCSLRTRVPDASAPQTVGIAGSPHQDKDRPSRLW